MKWILAICLALAVSASFLPAGGDKNRGDKGQGYVKQVVGP